jgi:hypothetical protein
VEIREGGFFFECWFNGGGGVVVFGVQRHSQCIRSHPFFVVSWLRVLDSFPGGREEIDQKKAL